MSRFVQPLLGILIAGLVCIAAPGAAAAADAEPTLPSRLEAALGARALRGARVAALVVRARDGHVLFERDADRALTPASNAKILTAIAALARFGPTHRLETEILADREPDAKGEVETLVVRGAGDPSINSEDWWRLADGLRRRGLERVRGDLVLDDSFFDRERWHPAWGRTSARAYHAPVGALNANYGAFSVTIRPGPGAGAAARVALSPPAGHLRVLNRALTTAAGSQSRLRVDREAAGDGELVIVTGGVAADEEGVDFYRSVLDPARYAGSVLRLQLEAVGIRIDGETRIGREPEVATLLERFPGRPIAEVVRLCMKYSNNGIAESLVKLIGADSSGSAGSWANGIPAMRDILLGLGLDPAGFDLVDGSGLSYENRVSPRVLVQALRVGEASFDFGPELMASLPLAAYDGTLEERAEGAAGAVRAKTGTLTRVTALSGFARLRDGEQGIFSILVNGYRSGDQDAMDAVDLFVSELVQAEPGEPLTAAR